MNAAQSLQLTATVSLPTVLAGNVTWKIDQVVDGFRLEDASLSPLTTSFPKQSFDPLDISVKQYSVYMGLGSNTLQAGLVYNFQLACNVEAPGISTTSSISINVNLPPQPGRFAVNPLEGTELLDRFTLVA